MYVFYKQIKFLWWSEVGGVATVTEYLGPYELVDVEFMAAYIDGGYFDSDGKVHYYVSDYQGNIIADVTARGKVEQTASYYPYGEPWVEPEGGNRRLYGGKERLNVGALRPSDFGARYLDTRSGRWNSHDSYSEKYFWLSPYALCAADPINNIDPSGNIIQTMINGIAYQYINGSDGWGFYNSGEQYQSGDVFADALIGALKLIQSGVVGSELVSSLIDSDKIINVAQSNINWLNSEEMTINWNAKDWCADVLVIGDSQYSQVIYAPFLSLAHEMFHAESKLFGYTYKKWGESVNGEVFCTDEKWAVYGENFIRAEHGELFRLGYCITNLPKSIDMFGVRMKLYPNHRMNEVFLVIQELY